MTTPRYPEAHTVPLVTPPTATMPTPAPSPAPGAAPRFADLPEAPAAYHEPERRPAANKKSKARRRPLNDHEQLGLAVGGTVLVLVLAKALADANDIGSNVVDVLLIAVLAAIVGVVIVGVGGGLIGPMRARWLRLLAPSSPEATREPYPTESRQP